MYYVSRCLASNCDYYWQGRSETEAFEKTRDHSEEHEGHPVRLRGTHEAPAGQGVYIDGRRISTVRARLHIIRHRL